MWTFPLLNNSLQLMTSYLQKLYLHVINFIRIRYKSNFQCYQRNNNNYCSSINLKSQSGVKYMYVYVRQRQQQPFLINHKNVRELITGYVTDAIYLQKKVVSRFSQIQKSQRMILQFTECNILYQLIQLDRDGEEMMVVASLR